MEELELSVSSTSRYVEMLLNGAAMLFFRHAL
jgi:hypothetical protein